MTRWRSEGSTHERRWAMHCCDWHRAVGKRHRRWCCWMPPGGLGWQNRSRRLDSVVPRDLELLRCLLSIPVVVPITPPPRPLAPPRPPPLPPLLPRPPRPLPPLLAAISATTCAAAFPASTASAPSRLLCRSRLLRSLLSIERAFRRASSSPCALCGICAMLRR